jgi:hypothetical protein
MIFSDHFPHPFLESKTNNYLVIETGYNNGFIIKGDYMFNCSLIITILSIIIMEETILKHTISLQPNDKMSLGT